MGKAKSRSGASTGSAKALSDLFRPYAIPPSRLHEAIQQAAEQAGWLPPFQRKQLEKQKVAAGSLPIVRSHTLIIRLMPSRRNTDVSSPKAAIPTC